MAKATIAARSTPRRLITLAYHSRGRNVGHEAVTGTATAGPAESGEGQALVARRNAQHLPKPLLRDLLQYGPRADRHRRALPAIWVSPVSGHRAATVVV